MCSCCCTSLAVMCLKSVLNLLRNNYIKVNNISIATTPFHIFICTDIKYKMHNYTHNIIINKFYSNVLHLHYTLVFLLCTYDGQLDRNFFSIC